MAALKENEMLKSELKSKTMNEDERLHHALVSMMLDQYNEKEKEKEKDEK